MKRAILFAAAVCCAAPAMAQLNAAMQAVLTPADNSYSCSPVLTPRVVIRNAGTGTITSLKINRQLDAGTPATYNWTGSLLPGGTDTITLAATVSAPGSHQFTAYTFSPNNGVDAVKTNDTLRTGFSTLSTVVASLPLTQGFESATFPPQGWTFLNPNPGSPTWVRSTAAGYKSAASILKDNFAINDAGQVDHVVLPVLNFSDTSNDYQLTFRRAYAEYSGYVDTLQVWVSTNCGGNWTKLYNKYGADLSTRPPQTSPYVPADSTHWALDTVRLFGYRGNPAVRVRITNASGFGNNLYLDDISVRSYPLPPIASFSVVDDTVCVGDTVRVVNTSIRADEYLWNLPGGTPSVSIDPEPAVVYGTGGLKTLFLTAKNQYGTSQAVRDVYVLAGPSPVIYKFALQLSSPVPYPSYQWYRNGQPIPGATGPIYYALHEGTYTLRVVSSSTGCSGNSNPIVITDLAVSTAALADLVTVAPNPTHGTVTLREALPGSGEAQVSFLNAVGQEVLRAAIPNGQTRLDINRLPAGIYTLRISKGAAATVTRLVVQ